jgi:hypothetical protein
MQLSPAKQQKILDLLFEGHSNRAIAKAVSCAQSTVGEYRNGRVPSPPLPAPEAMTRLTHDTVLVDDISPIRSELRPLPFAPSTVLKGSRADSGVITAILAGDKHFPFADEKALSILLSVTDELQPDLLIDMGDLIDCYHLSRFDKNPDRLHSLQDEIDQARAHLFAWGQCSPHARKVLLGGNHDARIDKMLWNLDGPAKALLKLTQFRKLMTMDGLLGLSEMNWEFVPQDKQTTTELLPKMVIRHGTVVRKFAGFSAKGEWERTGRSGASGHVHRLAVFMHAKHDGGSHVWLETGCLCSTTPEYMDSPDWQNGFMVVTVERTTGAFAIEPVYIRNGLAVFRGKTYVA